MVLSSFMFCASSFFLPFAFLLNNLALRSLLFSIIVHFFASSFRTSLASSRLPQLRMRGNDACDIIYCATRELLAMSSGCRKGASISR